MMLEEIFSIIFLLIIMAMSFGISFFSTLGLAMLIDSYFWRKNARMTKATVVDFDTQEDEGISYFSIVEYKNKQGNIIRSRNFQSSATKPIIGNHVDILYFDNKTETVRIKGFDACLLFGLPFAALPLFFYWELISNLGPFLTSMSLIGFIQGTIFFGCILYCKFHKYYNQIEI